MSPPEPANSLMIITFGPRIERRRACDKSRRSDGSTSPAGPVQHVDHVIRHLPAAVETLVDDDALLVRLREDNSG